MTTLIFATDSDASPLIFLSTSPVDVRQMLRRGTNPKAENPGFAAVTFLRSLSPDEADSLSPMIESTPMFNIGSVLEQRDGFVDLIVWNPETWQEWDLQAEDAAQT